MSNRCWCSASEFARRSQDEDCDSHADEAKQDEEITRAACSDPLFLGVVQAMQQLAIVIIGERGVELGAVDSAAGTDPANRFEGFAGGAGNFLACVSDTVQAAGLVV